MSILWHKFGVLLLFELFQYLLNFAIPKYHNKNVIAKANLGILIRWFSRCIHRKVNHISLM